MTTASHTRTTVRTMVLSIAAAAGIAAPAFADVTGGAGVNLTRNRRVERPIGTSNMLDSVPYSEYSTRNGIVKDLSLGYKDGPLEASTRVIAGLPQNVAGKPNAAMIQAASHSYVLQNNPALGTSAALEFSSRGIIYMNIKGIKVGIDPANPSYHDAVTPVDLTFDMKLTLDTLVQRNTGANVFDGVQQDVVASATFGSNSSGGEYHYFQFGNQTPRITTTGALNGATYNQTGQVFNFSVTATFVPAQGTTKDFSLALDLRSLFAGTYDQNAGIGATESFVQGFLQSDFRLGNTRSGFVEDGYIVSDDDGLMSNAGFDSTFFVPAPGSAALLGMGGLFAARRRR